MIFCAQIDASERTLKVKGNNAKIEVHELKYVQKLSLC